MSLPKVLIIGINAWREDASSHTLMDLFRCWNPERLALVYSRSEYPDTPVCNHFFQISETDILKGLKTPWKEIGNTIECSKNNGSKIKEEQLRYSKAHKKSSKLLPLLREIVWKFGKWKSKALKSFILDFDPDVIFIPIYPVVYMGRLQKYIKKLTGKPTICYLADDNYSYDSCNHLLSYLHRFWLRKYVGPLARESNGMFVIVDKEKEDTDKRFGTNSIILTKGIDFSEKQYIPTIPKFPLKLVYTGNLIIGRDKTIAVLADILNELNHEEKFAELYIYSQTEPNTAILKRINRGCSHFCGKISREEVKLVQSKADIVVFAEALNGKEANIAKLSFSTKLTDYMAAGKCIFAIGKRDIAPIDYLKKYNTALISSNEIEIKETLLQLRNDPAIITQLGKKAYETAKRNHDQVSLNQKFIAEIKRVASL